MGPPKSAVVAPTAVAAPPTAAVTGARPPVAATARAAVAMIALRRVCIGPLPGVCPGRKHDKCLSPMLQPSRPIFVQIRTRRIPAWRPKPPSHLLLPNALLDNRTQADLPKAWLSHFRETAWPPSQKVLSEINWSIPPEIPQDNFKERLSCLLSSPNARASSRRRRRRRRPPCPRSPSSAAMAC